MVYRMTAWVLLAILGIGGFAFGIILFVIDMPMVYVLMSPVGLILAIFSIVHIRKLNKIDLEGAYNKALELPEAILANWEDSEDHYLITKTSLFVNKRQYAFVGHQSLVGLRRTEKTDAPELAFHFQSTISRIQIPVIRVPIPQDMEEKLEEIRLWLDDKYLL